MSSKYEVNLISIDEKDRFMEKYGRRALYESKADIHGVCIKLLTDIREVKERWEESFYPMSANIRSHGRLVVTNEEGEGLKVFYDPLSKTAFLINVDYYGWIKSLALSIASDILEDAHGVYAIHGACVDVDGRGICLIAPPGTGKTTHTYGLLRIDRVRVVSDYWFFVYMGGGQPIAFASEKNFYIQADITDIWGEYRKIIELAEFDSKGRAIVNIRWIIGKGRFIPMTTLRKAILLKRDPEDKCIFRRMNPEEAVQYLEKVDFCNPHLLVKDERKTNLRKQFFLELFSMLDIYVVNTTAPIEQCHRAIREDILGL